MTKSTRAPGILATMLVFGLPTFVGCGAEKGDNASGASSASELDLEKGRKKCESPKGKKDKKGKKGKKGKGCEPPDPTDAGSSTPPPGGDAGDDIPTDAGSSTPPPGDDAGGDIPTDDPNGAICADSSKPDEKGYACSDWKDVDCSQAAEDWHYSQIGEDWLLANCQLSCKICTAP